MVFQSYALYPHMTVFDNLAFGLKLLKTPKQEIKRRVEEAAKILNLESLLDRKPRALSGGQRQRVALGRAIVREPAAFLMDEPLSNLDAKLRVQTRAEILRLQRRLETTTIYVTHDQVEAMTMGDRIAVLNRGTLQQVADPRTLYARPANTFVAGFIGTPPVNLFEARVAEYGASVEVGGALWRVGEAQRAALAGRSGVAITAGVRPEDLHMEAHGLAATLEVVEPLGSETLLYWKSAAGSHVSRATNDETPAVGTRAALVARPDGVLLFEPATGASLLAPQVAGAAP
jgi:multiple sugar transport system ATP-binding protein